MTQLDMLKSVGPRRQSQADLKTRRLSGDIQAKNSKGSLETFKKSSKPSAPNLQPKKNNLPARKPPKLL